MSRDFGSVQVREWFPTFEQPGECVDDSELVGKVFVPVECWRVANVCVERSACICELVAYAGTEGGAGRPTAKIGCAVTVVECAAVRRRSGGVHGIPFRVSEPGELPGSAGWLAGVVVAYDECAEPLIVGAGGWRLLENGEFGGGCLVAGIGIDAVESVPFGGVLG